MNVTWEQRAEFASRVCGNVPDESGMTPEMELHLLCEEMSSRLGYTLRGKVGAYSSGEAMALLGKVVARARELAIELEPHLKPGA